MRNPESLERAYSENTFEYRGKAYRLAKEGGIVIAKEKETLPEYLTRVVPDAALDFDENDILKPRGSNNDMVSLSTDDEWEKMARMFKFNQTFRVITVKTAAIVGPTFLAGTRILHNGEIMALVPKESITNEQRYDWQEAEEDYRYGEDAYYDEYNRDLYERLIVSRTRGFKPKPI
jgi:hypothetical protein